MQPDRDPYVVNSVDRALTLMTLVLDRGGIGVREAAKELGTVPSTVHRLLATMAHRGFMAQGDDKRYVPGPALLGARNTSRIPALVAEMTPYLAQLQREVGETVHLMVLVGMDIRLVDGLESQKQLRVGLRLGTQLPAHVSAGGKAILADLETEAVERLYAAGVPEYPGMPLQSLDNLLIELKEGRERRYWLNIDQTEIGMSVVSASISIPGVQPKAAMSIAMPTARFRQTDLHDLSATLLRTCDRARDHRIAVSI